MTEQNEVITLILAFGVLTASIVNIRGILNAIRSRLLLAAFVVCFAAWLFTVLEGLFYHDVFNLLEHICYLSGAVLLAVWVYKLRAKEGAAGL